jgi:hypothetical protein
MSPELFTAVEEMNAAYIKQAKEEVRLRWNSLKIDLSKKEIYEVMSGQLARQVTLATQFISSHL